MRKMIYFTVGLPASGKTTFATAKVAELKGLGVSAIRVNKDDIRLELGKSNGKGEKEVVRVETERVRDACASGATVIVDNTHFNPTHEHRYRKIAEEYGYEFEVVDFTDVPLEVCIQRDNARAKGVGESVIKGMWKKYLRPKPPKIEYVPELPDCVIVDLDGTISINDGHRGWFEYAKCGNDKPNDPVIDTIRAILWDGAGTVPIYMSGREDSCRDQTTEWIYRNVGTAWHVDLYMRKTGDYRDDAIVKRELYEEHVKGKYNVFAVFDDRDRVVEMWRSLGLTCFQVAEGDF